MSTTSEAEVNPLDLQEAPDVRPCLYSKHRRTKVDSCQLGRLLGRSASAPRLTWRMCRTSASEYHADREPMTKYPQSHAEARPSKKHH
ncbi:hypothetical protein IG631_13405 [Alternaria alternata]|nr:hypothetical protein IG631_13405 [Alternaria alternata]